MTLDELMEDKVPGSVKVAYYCWCIDQYFIPYFKDKHGIWVGLDQNKLSWTGRIDAENDSDDWFYYKEPPFGEKND